MIAALCFGLGLVLVIEGLVWAVAPNMVEQLLVFLRELPLPARRQIGALVMVAGAFLLWAAQVFGP